jgi:hypothetical protein
MANRTTMTKWNSFPHEKRPDTVVNLREDDAEPTSRGRLPKLAMSKTGATSVMFQKRPGPS